MKYIYYPEYELEYRQLLDKRQFPNHILNIRLLMFLCDHVVLPPSHLLYMNSDRILELKKDLKEFFETGKIVSIDYARGMDNYFTSRIDRITDPSIKRAKEFQAKLITQELFTNIHAEHNKTNEEKQLTLFDMHIKELLADSNRYKKQAVLLRNQMTALSYKTGEAVHSTQFRDILTDLLKNSDISRPQSRYFMNLMSNAYYYSGTYTMNTLVSYNPYFQKIDLQSSLIRTHPNATNLIVDPYFLGKLFSVIGIDTQDICLLRVSDYQEIKSHKYWTEFMALFETIYTSAQELDLFLKQAEHIPEKLEKRKTKVFEIFNFIFSDLLIPICLCIITPSPIFQIGTPAVLDAARMFLPPVKNAEIFIRHHTSDKIMEHIQRSREPLYEFCYRLKMAVDALR